MACQPTKCCCCAPLRPGLLAWAYIKLVYAFTYTGLFFYFSQYKILHLPDRIERYGKYYHSVALIVFEVFWPLGVVFLYLVFSIIFVIGVHRENFKLLVTFLVYSIFEVIASCVLFAILVDEVWRLVSDYYTYGPYHGNGFVQYTVVKLNPISCVQMIVLLVFNILLPLYFMVLIKSELQRLKRSEETVVLNQPETKQAATYTYVYCNETPALRKPLFPVEELQQLRQQMGVTNV